MHTLPLSFDIRLVAGFVLRTLKKALKRPTVRVEPRLAPVKIHRHNQITFPPRDDGTLR